MSRLLTAVLLFSVPALAATRFDPVPTPEGGTASGLLIRVVKYDGSTNGAITVEVKNPGATAASFDAKGLYFVPAVNPEQAPQRLGAVGPFRSHSLTERVETLSLEPGTSQKLTLDVYCIDSHRSSPTSETPFRVGKTRMPRQLSAAIETSTAEQAKAYGGVTAAPAKPTVQSEVWKTRDRKWIKLDGESAQEATK